MAKLKFAGGSSGEETRAVGALALLIERHPLLQKGVELCEKTTKTPFWLQKAMWLNAQVVAAKEVADFRGLYYAKIGRPALQKDGRIKNGAAPAHRGDAAPDDRSLAGVLSQ